MNKACSVLFVLSVVFAHGTAAAQKIDVATADGGSVVTDLGYNIKVNKNSTLRRNWVVLNDPGCPAQINGAGITTAYGDREYLYRQVGTLVASEPVTAIEIRYVLYDIFGGHLKTLSATSVADTAAGIPVQLSETGRWRAWENEVSELLTVVAFVAQVRSADGKVWRHEEKAISDELAKIRLAAGSGVLDPSKEK